MGFLVETRSVSGVFAQHEGGDADEGGVEQGGGGVGRDGCHQRRRHLPNGGQKVKIVIMQSALFPYFTGLCNSNEVTI